jgi:hypothetical protein
MAIGRMYRIAAVCLLVCAFLAVALVPAAVAKKRVSQPVSCHVSGVTGLLGLSESEPAAPVALSGPMDPAILGRFAVLRRPAGPADQLPPLSTVGNQLDSQLGSYYPGYIRQLAQLPDGNRIFLIPGFKRATTIPPAGCLPKSLRAQRNRLVEQQRKLAAEPVYCIAEIGSGPHIYPDCQTFAANETGSTLAEPDVSKVPVTEIVPDGVAVVRLSFRGGATVVAPVSENAFRFSPPPALVAHAEMLLKRSSLAPKHGHLTKRQRERRLNALIKVVLNVLHQLPPTQVRWLDASGNVLRSFTPRRQASGGILVSTGVSGTTGSSTVPIG